MFRNKKRALSPAIILAVMYVIKVQKNPITGPFTLKPAMYSTFKQCAKPTQQQRNCKFLAFRLQCFCCARRVAADYIATRKIAQGTKVKRTKETNKLLIKVVNHLLNTNPKEFSGIALLEVSIVNKFVL